MYGIKKGNYKNYWFFFWLHLEVCFLVSFVKIIESPHTWNHDEIILYDDGDSFQKLQPPLLSYFLWCKRKSREKLMMKSLFDIKKKVSLSTWHFPRKNLEWFNFCARKWRKSNKIFKFSLSRIKIKKSGKQIFRYKKKICVFFHLNFVYFNLWCLPDNNLIFTQ